ncbi:MAG TPA: hypothetical protein VHR97_07145 [Candidatus Baltobacteraceae bacterium]|jgi:hypothetical protein|nr:hypothetical protein [Candidatus Baltobacteraceae bacterium]
MKHYVIIHQKNRLPDLYDEYPSAEEARNAIEQIATKAGNTIIGSVVTPSKNVAFSASDFAGAVYKPDYSDEAGGDGDALA